MKTFLGLFGVIIGILVTLLFRNNKNIEQVLKENGQLQDKLKEEDKIIDDVDQQLKQEQDLRNEVTDAMENKKDENINSNDVINFFNKL